MSKPKYITKDNYLKFKPSEFVRSFISDIEVAEAMGKPMDMSTFEAEKAMKEGCLPCLGGMACMNMGISPYRDVDSIGRYTADLGDFIRCGHKNCVNDVLELLYPKYRRVDFYRVKKVHFFGIQDKNELRELKKIINQYADAIEKSGQ